MANQIQVTEIQSVITLYQQGWPKLRIAQALNLDVKTVRSYIRRLAEAAPQADPPPAGTSLFPPTGGEAPTSLFLPAGTEGAKPAILPAGKTRCAEPGPAGRRSQCAPFQATIEAALEQGLSAQRIYQDLVQDAAFAGHYDAVKRYVRRLRVEAPERFYRLECAPAEQAQVDFGRGAAIHSADGRSCKTWVLRIVLSYSRKAYSEAVLRQTTEALIRCLENAFRYFGGVVKTLIIDNLRAAVKRADWYEPELNPKVREFCRHYGTVMLPTRPRTPQHNGKAESSVGYVKGNALKARTFASLAEQNTYLLTWENQVADLRIHGTTRQQVQARFLQEKPYLLPLPTALFPCFQEGKRRVHRDSFVEVEKAYYEVPQEYIQRDVWVRWDGRLVRVFNERFEQVAVHARVEQGRFSHGEQTTSRGRLLGVERSAAWLVQKAIRIGPHCGAWADAVLAHRGVEGIRPLYGLLALCRVYPSARIDRSCAQALTESRFLLRELKALLDVPQLEQETLPFLESHPLIRDIAEYGQFLHDLDPEHEHHKPQPQEATKV